MRWIAVIAGVLTGLAFGQEPTPILTVQVAKAPESTDQLVEQPRLVEFIGRLASGQGMTLIYDPGGDSYTTKPEPDQPTGLAAIELDANAWRGVDPDVFVPGPMNALLGAIGLADVRKVVVVVDGEGERVIARWDRRQEDPRTTPLHERLLATKSDESTSKAEVWEVEGLGIGRFVVGALQAGLALEEGERKPSDWAFGDFWLRGRSTLLNSLERASLGAQIVITSDLRPGVVFRFDRAIKAESIERASLRIVPNGIPGVTIHGRTLTPEFVVASDERGAAVVIAPTRADLEGVLDALGLEAFQRETDSGSDRP